MMEVKAWMTKVSIPTYKAGSPELNPMFLEKRVYQGSSGVVYPHPVIEKIADEQTMQEYTAVYLENDYLQIMLLPELGGRVQRAYDKVRQRDFIYYNQVIKPALVGLTGPWISGGIEFNWPQHHRPSTFEPVDCTIRENADGSKTVWMNEIEIMTRTKGMAGFTLYPDKAYLEISGRLFNRTPFPQTFLWWANPAVKVNDHYQSVFPPDVYAVFDHGKRDVSDFPIATGTYYKVNYAPGTDISRYANIPVPTSYMAIRSKYDFIGCYEHDTQAGMLHVADHHQSPGKKQWTWGNSDFGQAWDRNLTDEDGPYIELMTGMFTDNQPDFSWLQPNEEKQFVQYFMPYAEIGVVKNATKQAMLNMEWDQEQLHIKVYVTADYPQAVIRVWHDDQAMQAYQYDLSPARVFTTTYAQAGGDTSDWKVTVHTASGKLLVAYQPEEALPTDIPAAATPALLPAEVATVEELFLNGLHLEQYRHATYSATDYYQEGLRRSAGDVRCNNAMGLWLLRRGQFAQAEPYFRAAIATLTQRNPNPYDGEPYYNLGWCLRLQGQDIAAYDAFYKATWNDAWQHNGFLSLARIACGQRQWEDALGLAERALIKNYHSHTVRHLKAMLLRKVGRSGDSQPFIHASLELDPFNAGCLFEQYLSAVAAHDAGADDLLSAVKTTLRGAVNNYLELSLDYAHAGQWEEADQLLAVYDTTYPAHAATRYYRGWFAQQRGAKDTAIIYFEEAARIAAGTWFPNKIEEILILQAAIALCATDAQAYYLLGNCWYDKRQYPEAIQCWERSAALCDTFPTVFRNLALASFNKLRQPEAAVRHMERAFTLDSQDARVLMELDQLYKILGRPVAERLSLLQQHPALVQERDDLYLEQITLYNQLGQYEHARILLAGRQFHPWEGGEGKVTRQYLLCHTALAKQAIQRGAYEDALVYLSATEHYPHHLGEGKLYGTPENDRYYLLGCVYEGLGDADAATAYFRQATTGNSEPAQAIYYNDPQPDKIIYQALAWMKLGAVERAQAIFKRFIQFGEAHLQDEVTIDYFAVSLPDMLVFDQDINQRNVIHCKYLCGLGYLGLGDTAKGLQYLSDVLKMDVHHQGAAEHQQMVPFFEQALATA
ncbi:MULTISPECIES: DUF5107 domain-containing protein [Chitinophaga]|uniref:DUF5107 domain-containing protein n=1 Tax=Chitinophaga TaxID=79328 RepID=UPI001CED8A43|nr:MULTISPECIES: DUF5107 domain-containing protein [Chitinophaga]